MNYEPLDVKLKRVVDDLDPAPSVPAPLATARETFVASSPARSRPSKRERRSTIRRRLDRGTAICMGDSRRVASRGRADRAGRSSAAISKMAGCTSGPWNSKRPGWPGADWCSAWGRAKRKYLAEIEAEHGPIKFRGLALEYIAAAEAKPPVIKPAERQPSRRKRAAKKKGSRIQLARRKDRPGRKFTTESRRAR